MCGKFSVDFENNLYFILKKWLKLLDANLSITCAKSGFVWN